MSTYVPIQAITLSSAAASVTFTGIPQTYTDLVVVVSGTVSIADNVTMRFNGDSGSNYSWTYVAGTGSSAISGRSSNTTAILTAGFGTTTIANAIFQIQNYSNSTTNKTVINRGNRSDDGVIAFVGLWRNTSAITSITVGGGAGNLSSGSTFTLYGIGSGSPKAFGGDEVRTDGTFWYHIFRSSGRFEPVQALSDVDYLVVAGGGGGGRGGAFGGGGGAGGLRCTVTATGGGGSLESKLSLIANTAYTVTIGAGGTGSTANATAGGSGTDSVFSTITSTAGGGGGATTGINGGSGGGGGTVNNSVVYAGGTGTANQGFAGGSGQHIANVHQASGGGGGAGAVGTNSNANLAGNGGNGVATVISGSSTSYGGGGGGGGNNSSGTGGTGGGGRGASPTGSLTSLPGTANTGGGGGGGFDGSNPGSNGGSGIVIIRYAV